MKDAYDVDDMNDDLPKVQMVDESELGRKSQQAGQSSAPLQVVRYESEQSGSPAQQQQVTNILKTRGSPSPRK